MKYLMLVLLITGCAFRESENQKQEVNTKQSASQSEFQISWGEEGEKISVGRFYSQKMEGEFSTNAPVTLSQIVPSEISIFKLPGISDLKFRASAEDIEEKSIMLGVRRNDAELVISGLRTILPDNISKTCILIISAHDPETGELVYRLRLKLVTPPAAISMEMLKGEALKANFTNAQKLLSAYQRLDLVSAIAIKNNENTPVELDIPILLSGTIQRSMTKYTAHQLTPCTCHQEINEWNEVYSGEIFLLPLNESLHMDWQSLIVEPKQKIILLPQDELKFGIFVNSKAVQGFVDNGLPQGRMDYYIVIYECVYDDQNEGRRHLVEKRTRQDKTGLAMGAVSIRLNSTAAKARYTQSTEESDPVSSNIQNLNSSIEIF